MSDRHICIHGHFYQPPRENPWLEVIEPQPTAAPFHDWNERISAECYAANARARIHDNERRIMRLANNYLNLSFNIGPTLMHWLAQKHPNTLQRIVAADRRSAERLGHGNALAQAYNHMIMPLAGERDLHTQILWGLADFRHHFGREAEGMWLPECAVNMDTVRALIDHGVRFIVLAPKQAARVRSFGSHNWHEAANGTVDTTRPYRVFDRSGEGRDESRWLDVFFYNEGISHAIAFGHLLRNAEKLAATVREGFSPQREHSDQLAIIGTDGESYGHHEPYGEMCLAFFFEELVSGAPERITNFAAFIADHPPSWEAELWEGRRGEGSSWSCKHGVERWYRNCGCSDGGKDWYNQEWRTPLREAFDALRERLDAIFVEEGLRIFTDPWDARDAYVRVLLDPSEKSRAAFLEAYAPGTAGNPKKETDAWRLLEMQRHAMLMYTSCGWFFADLGGLEPVQNMRYALRAAEHAAPYAAEDLEALLQDRLGRAGSNEPDLGSGADIFRREVLPGRHTEANIAACFVMMEMYRMPPPPFDCGVEYLSTGRDPLHGAEAFHGELLFRDRRLFTETRYAFLAAHINDRETACLVRPCEGEADACRFLQEWRGLPAAEANERLAKDGFLIRNMPREQRRALLDHVLSERLSQVEQAFGKDYEEGRPLLGILAENRMQPPEVLRVVTEFVLTRRFQRACESLARRERWVPETETEAKAILEEAERYQIEVDRSPAAPAVAGLALSCMDRLVGELRLETVNEAIEIMRFSREMGFFFENGGKIENRYWYLLRHSVAPIIRSRRSGKVPDGSEEASRLDGIVEAVHALGMALNFSEDHLDRLLAFTEKAEPDEGEN